MPAAPTAAKPPEPPSLLERLHLTLQTLPFARSLTREEAARSGAAPELAGREITFSDLPPLSHADVLERFAGLARGYMQVRERQPGEPVALGDAVLLNWAGFVEGQSEPFFVQQGLVTEVAPQAQLPGLCEALVGKPTGGQVFFKARMPEDHPDSKLRGGQARFQVQVVAAREVKLPNAESPEFLQQLGRGDTLEQVLTSLVQEMEAERTRSVELRLRDAVLRLLVEQSRVELDSDRIDEEIRAHRQAAVELAKVRPAPVEPLMQWLAEPSYRGDAELRLRLSLALGARCAKDGVAPPSAQEVELFLQELASGLECPVEELHAVLRQAPWCARLVEQAAEHLRAMNHALRQVKLRLTPAS